MKPLKPEDAVQVPGASRTPIGDLVGLDPIPLPLPQPICPDTDILKETP